MTHDEQIRHDLDYISAAVRRQEQPVGTPAIYFLWAVLVPVGFALPDFAPQWAGLYWLFIGIGGGLLSMWLGIRDDRHTGIRDRELGKRYGLHWLFTGLAFMLSALPLATGKVAPAAAVPTFMLIAGLADTLAGVHLNRPILWSGLLMFAAYAALQVFPTPRIWTVSGLLIGLSLAWAGIAARRARLAGAAQ